MKKASKGGLPLDANILFYFTVYLTGCGSSIRTAGFILSLIGLIGGALVFVACVACVGALGAYGAFADISSTVY